MFIAAIFTIVKTQKQSKCPSLEEWVKKIYTENFKRVTLTNSRLEVRMLRCGEGRKWLSSLTSFQGFNFYLIYFTQKLCKIVTKSLKCKLEN